MPLRILFLFTLSVAFAFFTGRYADWQPDDSDGARLQVSVFLLLQFFWFAINMHIFVTVRQSRQGQPELVSYLLQGIAWLALLAQFLLLCIVAPSLDHF